MPVYYQSYERMGCMESEQTWFGNYFLNRKQFVCYDGMKSELETVSCGVFQGSILGPLMFVLLINDIESQLCKCDIILYADDAVMFTSGKTKDQIEQALICDIQSISKWLRINNLVLNFKKGVMFGTSQKLSKVSDIGPLNITVNGSKINESATYKYLGVTLDKNLTFSEHLSSTFRKASARVKLLRRIRPIVSPH